MKLLFPLFFLVTLHVQAQQPQQIICRHINTKNGLIHGTITSIKQDKNGYIWLAGDEGLQRYDGYEFVNYFFNPNKPNQTFPEGRLISLALDNQDKIWIGSFADGFSWYNPSINSNKNYRFQSQPLLSSNAIGFRDFLFANDSTTFACSSDGLIKLVNNSITKTYTTKNSALQGGLVGHIEKDKNGNYWIGTVSGLNFLSFNEKYLYNHTNNTSMAVFAPLVLKDNTGNKAAIAELKIDSKNNLWISTWEPGLYRYNIDKNILNKIILPEQKKFEYDNLCTAIEEDNEGNIWIGTSNNGLYKYQYSSNSFQHFLHHVDDAQSIGSNSIEDIMKDNLGNLWLASENSLSVFNPSYQLIQHVLPNNPSQITATLVARDKTIWAVDKEWLFHFDTNLALLKKYRHQPNINPTTQKGNVWGLKESINGQEIFLKKDNGIAIFNKQNTSIDLFKDIPILADNPVTDIIELNNGNFYLCRWWWGKNLLFVNRNQRIASAINLPIDDKNNFEIATAIKKDEQDYYLISKKGLMLLNTKQQTVSMLDSTYLSGNTILVNQKLYSATATTGIRSYDLITRQKKDIGKYEGLSVNNTKSIAFAGNDVFWISSASGLIKWNSKNNTFLRFGEDDGILNSAIYGNSLAITANGKIIFSNGSLMMLDTAKLFKRASLKANIISCIAGDSVITSAQFNNTIAVSYTNNIIQLKFAAINNLLENVKYEYILEGYDNVWRDGSLRIANYTNLPHGSYTFKVRAAGNDGIWSDQLTTLTFYVSQAFYKAWWFYFLLVAIVLAAILFYYKIRINRILELQKLRNNISRDLHDEVGSTLSSISILSTSVINNMDREPAKTKEWVAQIGKYAQHMLNVMDDIVWSINPKMDGFLHVVSRMKEAAYSTTEAADIKVVFEYDEQLNNLALPMLTKRNLYLIFKEAVNNAVKHAACKNILIALWKNNNCIRLIIKDDGAGFDTTKDVNRNGLKNIKQRASEINGIISVISQSNIGTTIELNILL
jgi:ligand-binding sensor domain-containing protein/two-component sensor histidine kinase